MLGEQPGDAAGMKLLRSIFMKGLAAIAIESLEAAKAAGVEDRVRADITGVIGEPLLECSSPGRGNTPGGVSRRCERPRPTSRSSGVEPRMATAAAEWLVQIRDAANDRGRGLPRRLPLTIRRARVRWNRRRREGERARPRGPSPQPFPLWIA